MNHLLTPIRENRYFFSWATHKFFLLIPFFLCLLHSGFGQQRSTGLTPDKNITQFLLDTWSAAQGLPYNNVNYMVQSKDGYLWLATFGGLIRFDGVSFDIYNKKKYEVFKTNGLYKVFADSAGRVWMGSQASGLLYYEKGKIKTALSAGKEFYKPITAVFSAGNNEVWLGTINSGVFRVIGKDIQPVDYAPLRGITVRSIAQSKSGEIWFASEGKGLVCYQNGKYQTYTTAEGLPQNKVTVVQPTATGGIWAGTITGLCKVEQGKVEPFPELQNYQITALVEDSYRNLWIGTDRGLFRRNGKNGKLESFSEIHGLPHNQITSLLFDRENSLWITTWAGGICRLRDGKFTNFSVVDGLPSKAINYICEISPEKYYIATDAPQVTVIDKGQVSLLPLKTKLGDNVTVRHIMKDSKGRIWISLSRGLLLLNGEEEKLYTMQQGLPEERVQCTIEDPHGNIWIGFREGGLIKLSPDGKMSRFSKNNGLSGNFVTSLHKDRQGNIWVGLNNGGLDMIQPDGTFIVYDQKKGLSVSIVFNTYVDAQAVRWLTTNSGLVRFENDKFEVFNTAHGFPADTPFDVLEDKLGSLWMTSADGIFKVRKQDIEDYRSKKIQAIPYVLYDEADGLRSRECGAGTRSLRASDGKIWFCTVNGVAIVDPSRLPINKVKPPVFISGFEVDNQALNPAETYSLDAGAQRLAISFTALSMIAPKKVKFRYKLEKFDKEWVEVVNERQVQYTNLPPGHYVFRVMACNNDGIWSERESVLSFTLQPHFYQTSWFYLLLISGGLLSFVGVYQWRVQQIQKRNNILERMVEERTLEIRRQKEDIQLQNRALEEQKQEILTQNEELEQQSEEILAQRDHIENKNEALEQQKAEILLQKTEVEKLYSNILTLSEIGQEITTVLNLSDLIATVYQNVNALMPAECFGIGIYDERTDRLEFSGFIEKAETLPTFYDPAHTKEKLSGLCFSSSHEIVINDIAQEYHLYVQGQSVLIEQGEMPFSVVYMPLMIENQPVGVITVQSFQKNAYTPQDITILRTLASYIAIAVSNARNYHNVEMAHKVIASRNKNIMDSIRYAQTIQHAILPKEYELYAAFTDHFIIYKPRDVVSGDFYWTYSIRRGMALIGVLDCTGHGVPGAFMSLIGYSLLNEIVSQHKVHTPSLLLEVLHQKIRTALKQEEEDDSEFGMDGAICLIETLEGTGRKLTFAGAKRPLYYTDKGQFYEIKGARRSIGGEVPLDFIDHELMLQEGDCIYLSTDGFADQSNTNRTSFGSARLKSFVASIASLPMDAQKQELLLQLDSHQQEQPQRDDITLLGGKL